MLALNSFLSNKKIQRIHLQSKLELRIAKKLITTFLSRTSKDGTKRHIKNTRNYRTNIWQTRLLKVQKREKAKTLNTTKKFFLQSQIAAAANKNSN